MSQKRKAKPFLPFNNAYRFSLIGIGYYKSIFGNPAEAKKVDVSDKINENETTLSEIIELAGGFRTEASLTEATLTRHSGTSEVDPEYERLKTMLRADMTDDEYDYLKAKSRQREGKVVVDFYLLFKKGDKSEDVMLKKGDVINIPEAKDYVILLGQVVNPGNIIYEP